MEHKNAKIFEFGPLAFLFCPGCAAKLPDKTTGVENMSAENYNCPRFYKVLGEKGPDLIIGVDKKVIDCYIRDQAKKRRH